MLRNMLYLIPVLLLVGTGCVIGNSRESNGRAENDTRQAEPREVDISVGGTNVEGITITKIDTDAELVEQAPVIVDLKSGNFFFDPPLISAKPGQEIEVHVRENRGLHTFVIDELALREQMTVGNVFRFTAPDSAGDYTFYCDIGEHRTLGMEGILRIEE